MSNNIQTVSIINADEQSNHDNFIIRKLSNSLYNIEESNIPIEITNRNTMFVTTAVIDSVSTDPQQAQVETKEYIYRTKNNYYFRFTVNEGKLIVESNP